MACRLLLPRSTSSRVRGLQELWCTGLVAPGHVGSSWTRDRIPELAGRTQPLDHQGSPSGSSLESTGKFRALSDPRSCGLSSFHQALPPADENIHDHAKLTSTRTSYALKLAVSGLAPPPPIVRGSYPRDRELFVRFTFASLVQGVSSVQFSHSVLSDSLWSHGLQHARLPCPSPTPGVYSNSSPSSQWCHPTVSSSVIPFSSHLQSFPASGGQNIGVSASASVLPMNIQDWFPLWMTPNKQTHNTLR